MAIAAFSAGAKQYLIAVHVPFTYADWAIATTASATVEQQNAAAVPAKMILVVGIRYITTAFNDSGPTETYDMGVGDSESSIRYLAEATAADTDDVTTALVPTEFATTVQTNVTISLLASAGATNPNAGAGFLYFSYVVVGRSNENDG